MILFIICYLLWVVGDGYSDGIFKKLGTERHWTKWPPRIGIIGMILIASALNPSYLILIGIILAFKPLFDIGWSLGRFNTYEPFIGDSDWTDKIIRKLKLDKLEKNIFPILTFIYFICIVMGLLLIVHFF